MTELQDSISQSKMTILGVDLTVHVLDGGRRFIEGDGLGRLLVALANNGPMSDDDAMNLAKIVRR